MTRDLNTTLQTRLRDDNPKVTVLVEIGTGTTPATIYITNNDVDLVFPSTGGTTYTARGFVAPENMISPTERKGGSLNFADADGYWKTWRAATDFRFQRVNVKLIDRDAVSLSTYARLDGLRVVGASEGDSTFSIDVEQLSGILAVIQVPRRDMTREDFPGMPLEGVI